MGEKILVVDDEKEIADLIEVYLKNDGYTVYKYYNGTDALRCIEETELDLAILDIMLPDIDWVPTITSQSRSIRLKWRQGSRHSLGATPATMSAGRRQRRTTSWISEDYRSRDRHINAC